MKRALLVLALTALLVMAAHSMALGAIHHSTGDMPNNWDGFDTVWTDTWFYIDGESPKVLFAGNFGAGYHEVDALVFKNDQTFVQGRFGNPYGYDFTDIAASYLFKNNVFAAMEYWVDSESYLMLTLGYVFNIGDNDYIALSLDYYAVNPDDDANIEAYDVDFKFFGDNYYFYGQLYFYEDGDDGHYIAYNYQFSETFVGGLFLEMYGSDMDLGGGFTWSPEGWIVDFSAVLYENDETESAVSAMYQANDNLWIGLEIGTFSSYDDNQMIAKAKYDFASGQLRAMYGFGNDNPGGDSYFALGYEMKLK